MTRTPAPHAAPAPALRRELGVFGATMMGLGSIVGTGIFVSIGIAAGVAGPAVILAIALAACVAACNAFSSAQLAANHPVSGGTYEYGHRCLTPMLGFIAGWMFLCAKTASAATAALGFSGYALALAGADSALLAPVAAGATALLTLTVLAGVERSNQMNIAIVAVTLGTLGVFVLAALPRLAGDAGANLTPFFPADTDAPEFLYATALMFVAYTGYGRIATLGEEVKAPRRTIPRAIIMTLIVSAALYTLVAAAAIGAAGVDSFSSAAERSATPLEAAARSLDVPLIGTIVALGAVTAMLGVLLNLILGLSRVVFAMGRRGDLPSIFARIDEKSAAPAAAVIGVGLAIAGFALAGGIETAWSFSAFTVLIYYAITNLAALRLSREQRLYHPAVAVVGLAACLFLAFWTPPSIWLAGLALIGAGLIWRFAFRKLTRA